MSITVVDHRLSIIDVDRTKVDVGHRSSVSVFRIDVSNVMLCAVAGGRFSHVSGS